MSKAKILIVEDEILIAENIKRSIVNNGFTVTSVVTSGEQAIIKADEDTPDLILMDIYLDGDLDGIEASQIIQNKYDIPVIFLSAHNDQDTFKRAIITGPFGYITKPFEERQLSLAIEVAINKDKVEKGKRCLGKDKKGLHGILPICSHCKQIRDKDGIWHQIENYIATHSEAVFSHSVCPNCVVEHYSEFKDE